MTRFSEASLNVAAGYAKALFQLAEEQDAVSDVSADLNAIHRIFMETSTLIGSFEATHTLDDEGCHTLVSPLLDRFHPLVDKTLRTMASNHHVVGLPALFTVFTPYYEAYREIGHVHVSVAMPLSKETHAALAEKFEALFELKRALLHVEVDPSLLGGLYVEYNGQRFDASIKRKLNHLQTELSNV